MQQYPEPWFWQLILLCCNNVVLILCAGVVLGDGQHFLHQVAHPAAVRPQGLYQGQGCWTSSSQGKFPVLRMLIGWLRRIAGFVFDPAVMSRVCSDGFAVSCWFLGNSRHCEAVDELHCSTSPLPTVRSVQRQCCKQRHIVCTRLLSLHAQALSCNVVLKDLDLRQHFKVEPSLARRIHEQVEADTRLLASVRVMDYSMLLGVLQGSGSSSKGGAPTQGISAVQQPQQQQQQVNFAEHSHAAGMQGFALAG